MSYASPNPGGAARVCHAFRYLFLTAFLSLCTGLALAQKLPAINEIVGNARPIAGYFNLYWDDDKGKLYWEIDQLDTEFLYQISMGSGLGSNPVGIDRGQLSGTHVLYASRAGSRVLLIERNYRYRATSDNELERIAVEDAFAPSVHWGFDIVAEQDDNILVDATPFFLRDARDVSGQIATADQGNFALDASRSAIYLPNTAAYPNNVEVEAMLTFTSSNAGQLVSAVAASGSSITLRQHHSIVKLPDDNYKPRLADPRIGTFGPTIQDYGTDLDTDLQVRLVARHRLEKKYPQAAPSEAIEPIVYYVDSGTPEPIKSALIEGAAWWNQAFEAAGFIDAFQVRELPQGADPQDVRYNMIHWTHRRTRGYSYGGSVQDPRTGEIIKGNVNLGSLRLRQDYLMAQGLIPAFDYLGELSRGSQEAVDLALSRVRQLSAHEVGHTLGFPHNYLASAFGRESVMDYPAPLVEIENGRLDLSNAYLQRIGDYDKLAIRYSYEQFPPGISEQEGLAAIVQESLDRGLIFMAHNNNHFRGAGHQFASVWDNGTNLVDHLRHEIEVRRIGLETYGETVIRENQPLSDLEFVLLPLYMHHRFQLNAAAQSIGGADYRYALRGDGQIPLTITDAAEQRRALEVVLSTLRPEFLALPDSILNQLPPLAYRHTWGEPFPGRTGLLFDPLGAAEGSANLTVQTLLHPARMARLVAYGSMGDYPTLEEVIDRLIEFTWRAAKPDRDYHHRILNLVQRVTIDEMMVQASDPENGGEVKAVLSHRLDLLANELEDLPSPDAHQSTALADIRRWQANPEAGRPRPALQMPAGDPI